MFGVPKNIRDLPLEVVYLISKYLREEDKLSLAVSEAHKRYSSLYSTPRSLVINYKCFHSVLTPGSRPGSWNHFFTQYLSPETIMSFSAIDCYWLTGDHIVGHIKKMTNLQALGISGTKISLGQLGTVFLTCKKITKLDFSYQHLSSPNENSNQLNTPAVLEAFKKLISLKVSTTVRDFRDYLNDPWVFIYKILSWCEQCKEVTLDITHTGDCIDCSTLPASLPASEINRLGLPPLSKMSWMRTSLKSIAIIKRGSFNNFVNSRQFGGVNVVRSVLLDNILDWMFPAEPQPPTQALERFWILDFHVSPGRNRVLSVAPQLKSFRDVRGDDVNVEGYDTFHGHLEELGNCAFSALAHLPNLKLADGQFFNESGPQNLRDFIGSHRSLEHLGIDSWDYVSTNGNIQLLKLKSLYCSSKITKDVVDDMVKAYPNIQALYLESFADNMDTRFDRDCLSAIRFPRLTSLSLHCFNFQDGAFLKQIVNKCPKLEKLYFIGVASLTTPFLFNHLDNFLKNAPKLRDFVIFDIASQNNVSDALILLKFLLRCSSHLERVNLHLEHCNRPDDGDWGHLMADFLVEFSLKMERLTALSLTFCGVDRSFLEEANRRIVKEVMPLRPSLWFHLDSESPDAADPSVPAVHYREMVDFSGNLTIQNLPTFVSPMS